MATPDTIVKQFEIQFNNTQLIDGIVSFTKAIDENKKKLSDLKKEVKEGTKTDEEYAKAKAKIIEDNDELQRGLRAYQKELRNNIKIEKAAEGSIEKMEAQVAKLEAQYKRMPNVLSSSGKALAAQIKEQKDKINEAKTAIGDYRSKVGSYEEAIKSALGMNKLFGSSFSLLASPVGLVVGLIGGATAAFKLFKESLYETQRTGDALDYEMAGWSGTWSLFKKAVATVDFSLFVRNAAEAYAASRNLKEVLDEMYERVNSINLQEARARKEQANRLVILRDVTKSLEERRKAGEEYIAVEESLGKQRVEAAKTEYEAQRRNLFALVKDRKYATEEEKKQAEEAFGRKIEDYNLTLDQIHAATEYINKLKEQAEVEKGIWDTGVSGMPMRRIASQQEKAAAKKAVDDAYSELVKYAGDKADDFIQFMQQYQLTADKQVTPFVESLIKYYEADASAVEKTLRARTTVNSIINQQTNAAKKAIKAEWPSNLEEILKAMDAESERLVAEFDKVIDDEMRRQWQKRIDDTKNKYIPQLLEAEKALYEGGDRIDYDNTVIGIQLQQLEEIKRQLESLSVEQIELLYGTEEAHAEKLIELLKTINTLRGRQAQLTKTQTVETQKEVVSTEQVASGTRGLANAIGLVGEESEATRKVLAALAVVEATLVAYSAVKKAVESSKSWIEAIVAIAAMVGSVAAAISTLKSKTDAQDIKGYAEGGLVVGPGTGTSDSVPAMLSNGEAVMTAQAVQNWGTLLSMMNVSSGGAPIVSDKVVSSYDSSRLMRQMLADVFKEMPAPQVAVVDINRTQQKVKVLDNISKLGGKK